MIKPVQGPMNLPQKIKKVLVSLSLPVGREGPSQIFNMEQSYRGFKVYAPTKIELYNSTKGFNIEG